MIDKGKYASHGAYIKRIPQAALAQREKPKLGHSSITQLSSIHFQPLSREHLRSNTNFKESPSIPKPFLLSTSILIHRFRFQDNIDRKPVSQ